MEINMIYLEDIKDEKAVMEAVAELEISAIEASEAIANKRNKIIRAERDINALLSYVYYVNGKNQ